MDAVTNRIVLHKQSLTSHKRKVMSIAIIKIKDEEVPVLKKIVKAFTKAKLHIIKNDGDEEKLMSQLIEEGLSSEIIPTDLFKKELKKDAGYR